MSLPLVISELFGPVVSDAVLVKYFHVASVALAVYDYLLMLPVEIRYIWKDQQTFSWKQALYLLTRYLCFVDVSILSAFLFDAELSPNSCGILYRTAAWFEFSGIIVAEVILLLRTHAIWQGSRTILYIIISLSSVAIPGAVVMYLDMSTLKFPVSPIPTIVPCISSGEKSILYIDYALVLGVEFVVIALTICIGLKQWKEQLNPMATVLYRDAFTFSSILFATSIANVTVLAGTSSIALHLLLLEPQRVLHSVLTSRIILHLRIASDDTPEEVETLSTFNAT
ncbi:hypothetical protein SCHPADRAFT_163975 [Schizopora paradoxa]|uniref:DUF6533 domain-containing protein n=1 Tax=Schizopora paradoxa TaxID=27342 RepID=A0A0H2SK92_9AGAM|nr:hypothetical protein SCHPADRAFT_163975 [Schizopora paradoxa]